MFEGAKPRWWVKTCERFFQYYRVVESQRINLTTTYFNDMADAWFQGWNKVRDETNWANFVEEFCVRFGEKPIIDTIEEFNKLK